RAWLRAAESLVTHRIVWAVGAECVAAPVRGPGALTRVAVAREVWRSTRSVSTTARALATGEYPRVGLERVSETDDASRRMHAERLVQLGVATRKRKLGRA